MKKKLLLILLGMYLLFIVSIPLIYFFFYGPTQDYRSSVAFDTKNQSFFLIGDSFVLENVLLNDKSIAWQKRDNVYRSVNLDYDANKLYQLSIMDKQKNFINLEFRFPQESILEKQILDISCKASVSDPEVTINKDKMPLFDGVFDTEYVFSEKDGAVINVKNIVVDFRYKTESSKISYGKLFKGVLRETSRYLSILWNFFVEFNKFVFKAISSLFGFVKDNAKPVGGFMGKGLSKVADVTYSNDNSLFHIGEKGVSVLEKRVSVITDHFLAVFRNNYLFIYVNNISKTGNSFIGTMQSNVSDVFRGANNFFQRTVVSERIEKQKRKEVVVKTKLTSKIYKVASRLDGVEFEFVNALGEIIANERVKVSFTAKGKNNPLLLTPMTVFTDKNGKLKVSLRFGHKVGNHELQLNVKGNKFVYAFKTEPEAPFIISDVTNRAMVFQRAGKLMRKAFVLKVYDQYKNEVPGAKVQLLEQDIDEKNEPFVFAEAKSDKKGKVSFDYRLSDNSGRSLIIAKLEGTNSQFAYTVQSESTKPVEIIALGQEEVEAIIGIPLKAPFKVKVLDDKGNPCPHIPIDFSFQTSTFEELEAKRIRTDKNGIAIVNFRTPEVVGYFQVIASSPKVPEYEAAFVVLVMPGNAAQMKIVTGNNQTIEWEKNSEPLVIHVLDDKKNPIPNAEVKWSTQKNISFVDLDETTDLDGYARAVVKVGESDSKENIVVAQVGKVRQSFKISAKQPSFYKLYLVSKPVLNVFTSQMLAEPIEFVLRDQYGAVLPDEKVNIEYIVYKRGVQYLQNYTLATDKEGRVSFNFVASDQKDVINLKGKYFVDGKPRITWVKINAIPEEISSIVVPDFIEGVVGSNLDKPIQVFVADNNASPVVDIFLSVRLKKAPSGAIVGKESEQVYQLKTNRQGMAEFNPILGNLKGDYIYTAKINTLEKDIVVKAVPDRPTRIRLVAKDNPRFPVFRQVSSVGAQFYDKNDNLITKGTIVYGINNAKKVLKHDFNKKVEISPTGYTVLPFQVPDNKGKYYLYVTDASYSSSVFYQFDATESGVDSLIIVDADDKSREYVAGKQYKGIYKTRVVDRYGNFVEKAKLSMDMYFGRMVTTSAGADAFTDAKGIAMFDIVMPEKAGRYNVVVYSDFDNDVKQAVVVDVKPEVLYSAVILSGNNQVLNPGASLAEVLSIKLSDIYENPMVGEQVRWSYAVDVKGENRQYIQTVKTDRRGISTFNFVADMNPGVKEIKAYYKRGGKWEYVSYYVKVLGLSVSSIKKIAGDSQEVLVGKEIPEMYVVKAFDLHGNSVQDMPIIFQLISDEKGAKGAVVLEKMSKTDVNGFAKQKFTAPVALGKYKIIAYPQFQDKLKTVFDLSVVSEKIKQKKSAEKNKDGGLLKLVPLQSEKVVVNVNDGSRLCEIQLVDRLNNPVPNVPLEWEIYEVAKDASFVRRTKTDSEGRSSMPDINRAYERKFVVKVVELNSRASVIFNVDIVKDLASEVSLNYVGLPVDAENPKQEESQADPAPVDFGDDVVVINNEKIVFNRSNKMDLFVGQQPYRLKIYNNKDRVVAGSIKVGKNRKVEKLLIEPSAMLEVLLTPDVRNNIEDVTVSIAKNRMIPWMSDKVSFKLNSKTGSIYNIAVVDRLHHSTFINQTESFSFLVVPKVGLVESKSGIELDIRILSKVDGSIKTLKRIVPIGDEYKFENTFDDPGEYSLVISSYLLANKIEYNIRVFDGEYLIRPLSGFGEYLSKKDVVRVPLSLDVIYSKTRNKVAYDAILWELVQKPLGAIVDFNRRSVTNANGIVENNVVCSPISGRYIIRARRLYSPDVFYDFVFDIK